jgi:CubicO group peptidase (beta-lactamase class C family)
VQSHPGLRWQAVIESIVRAGQREARLPGMVIGVTQAGAAPEYWIAGADAAGVPLTAESLFPVASLTKLATALAVLRLAAAGELQLDAPLAEYLPEATAAAREAVTLRTLLAHTSGLPYAIADGLAPYTAGLNWRRLAQGCLQTAPATAPHVRVAYSNVGMGLLALVVERLSHQTFAEALAHLVLAPLQIEAYLGVEPPRRSVAIAREPDQHTGTPREPYNTPFWRSLALPWGGLLTTAAGALALAEAFAGRPNTFLPSNLRAEAVRDQTTELGGGLFDPWLWAHSPWGLGVELRGKKHPHWTPALASGASFGHVGASGCLVWFDPAVNLTWTILGARTFESWWDQWPAIGAALLARRA